LKKDYTRRFAST